MAASARKMAGELSTKESDELEIFLRNNPVIATQVDIITALWKQPVIASEEEIVIEKLMRKINVALR